MIEIDNVILELSFLYGVSGGAQFTTLIQEFGSGNEQRLQAWEYPLSKWNVGGKLLVNAEDIRTWEYIQSFFVARQGSLKGFYYKDLNDWQATNEAIGIGDGATTEYQLIKTYATNSGTPFVRKITRIIQDSLTVSINDSTTSQFTVNLLTGKIVFDNPVGSQNQIKASYDFVVPARFLEDELPVEAIHESYQGLAVEIGSLTIEEVRL